MGTQIGPDWSVGDEVTNPAYRIFAASQLTSAALPEEREM